ncbi:MAG TPA: hypothetical protein VLF67_03750, partial [Candidatus Saccharimonas sp.]|nr:hypothetical protein [Candidatus Saccharimonas sp.]
LRAQLDLGQTTSAAASAGQLLSQSTDPADQVLAALAFNAAGRGQDLSLLISHVSSPEVLQRIQRTSTSQLGLGVELYATGLLQVSQEVLVKLADSNIRDLILGQITLAQHSQKSYVDARGYFQTVLDDNPANLEARRGLIASLRGLGDNAAAARQTQLLEQLQAGTP